MQQSGVHGHQHWRPRKQLLSQSTKTRFPISQLSAEKQLKQNYHEQFQV